jgi:hypothetical protein
MTNDERAYQYHLDEAERILARLKDSKSRKEAADLLARLRTRRPGRRDAETADELVSLVEVLDEIERLEAGDLELRPAVTIN